MQQPARVMAPTKQIIFLPSTHVIRRQAEECVRSGLGHYVVAPYQPPRRRCRCCRQLDPRRNGTMQTSNHQAYGRNHGTDADGYTLAALPSFIHYSTHPLLLLASSAHRVAALAYSLQIPRCTLTYHDKLPLTALTHTARLKGRSTIRK
jgi:hypothetical protein